MPTLIANDVYLDIPEWVTSLSSFRRWTDQPDFPENGNIWWLRGKIWADMSNEQVYTHVRVKGEYFRVLANLQEEDDRGMMLTDGLLFTNEKAGLSGNPDGTFISHESLLTGRVVLIRGKRGGVTEVQGSPDMLLEVVSDRSKLKDLTILREDYFLAGVEEYWIVDARKNPPIFEILRRNSKGFVATRKQNGWLKSAVFGKSFRLIVGKDRAGNPKYTLEVR